MEPDHKPITFLECKRGPGRQVRVLDDLQEHLYEVEDVMARESTVPGILSGRPDHILGQKPVCLKIPGVSNRINWGYRTEVFVHGFLKVPRDGEPLDNQKILICVRSFSFADRFIHCRGSEFQRGNVPDLDDMRETIIGGFHQSGHFGKDRALYALSRYA